MNIQRILPTVLAAVLAIGAAGGIAQAQDRDGRDAAALAGMKVTLTQAIATAEGQAGGRAISADVSQEGVVTRISVEVSGPQGVKTVLLDGATGQVTATRDGDTEDND